MKVLRDSIARRRVWAAMAAGTTAGCGPGLVEAGTGEDETQTQGEVGTESDAPGTAGSDEPPDEGSTSGTEGSPTGGATDDPSDPGTSGGVRFDVGGPQDTDSDGGEIPKGCAYVDILFVVDISGSMREERENLQMNFPGFVDVLDDYIADPASPTVGYRIGVTNSTIVDNGAGGQSTMGLDGSLARVGSFGADCGLDENPWIEGPGPTVVDTFSCLAENPTSGCTMCSDNGKERPLDAMEMFVAKHAPGQDNEGFYRGEDALLVVVNITDEDDDAAFSTTQPERTKEVLDAFTGGDHRYVAVTVAGPEMSGCTSAFGDASPAPRLHGFTRALPNGLVGDICQADLAAPLADAFELIRTTCEVL